MKITKLSPNGFMIEEVYSEDMLNVLCNLVDTFTPNNNIYDDKRQSYIPSKQLKNAIASATEIPAVIKAVELWRDYPGYENALHYDDEIVKNIVIVYLGDGEGCGTCYIDEDGQHSIPYKKNTGIILLNSNKVLHGMIGQVQPNTIRKSIYMNGDVSE